MIVNHFFRSLIYFGISVKTMFHFSQHSSKIWTSIYAVIKSKFSYRKGRKVDIFFSFFSVYKNCAEIYKSGAKISGVHNIDPDGLGEFEVYCDQKTAGGGWTVFQKRQDGSVGFYRGWDDYKRGFGNLTGEFWLGLDKIHRLTESNSNKLRVDLEDVHGKTAFAEYSSFVVENEGARYKLNLGTYSGMPTSQITCC